MTVEIVRATEWVKPVAYVAENLRSYDVAELWCISRDRPEEALRQGIEMSQEAYVGYWRDVPVAVFGCHTTALGLRGVPWLLGTDTLTRNPRPFLSFARRYLSHLRAAHTELSNVVHSQNAPSMLFLRRLGFEMSEPYQIATGAVVHTFTMKGDLHV